MNTARLVLASTILTLVRVAERIFGPTPDQTPGEQIGATWVARYRQDIDE